MADTITISLANVQNIKTVNIVGAGIVKVRRLGSGEELDLSAKIRRLGKVINELSSIDFTKLNTKDTEDVKKIAKLTKKVEALSDEITEIKQAEFEIYKRCFSDDEDGKVVDVIMNTLTESERAELFNQVFGERTVEEVPEIVTEETNE